MLTLPGMTKQNVSVSARRPTDFAVTGRHAYLVHAIAFGLCCAAVLLLTTHGRLNQPVEIDPYIYAGYIHDYRHLVERFGRTYFSTRIAFIYPDRVLAYLFGLEGGYLTFRFIELTAAAAAVFTIGVRFLGYAPAILAATWLCFIPWLPSAIFRTHYDGTAVVYLLVGAAFLLVPTRRRLAAHVAAGAAFALAVNCNLFLLTICGLLGPGWIYFYRREGAKFLTSAIVALGAGFLGAYLILAIILYVQYRRYGFFFEIAAVKEALFLLGGAQKIWYQPLSVLIWQRHDFKILIPLTLLAAALALVARRAAIGQKASDTADFEVLALIYLACIVAFYLFFHFVVHAFWLEDHYYPTYFVPASVLAVIVLGGEVERRVGGAFGTAVVAGGAGLILILWLARPVLPQWNVASSFYLWLGLAAVTAAAAVALYRIRSASIIVVAGAALLGTCLYQHRDGLYAIRDTLPEDEAKEWDVYRGAIALTRFVDANVSPSQPIGFWYTGDAVSALNSLQSVYQWTATRVFPVGSHGMPLVDNELRANVTKLRYLVLLGMSDAEIDRGLAALEAAGLPPTEIDVKRAHFVRQKFSYTAALVQMKPPARTIGPLSSNVPLPSLATDGKVSLPVASFLPTNGGWMSVVGDAVQLTTAARHGSYSLAGRLRPDLQSVHGPVTLRVRLRVEEGSVGVAVTAVGNNSRLIRQLGIDASLEPQDIVLEIPEADAADQLIVRNRSASGRSRVLLYSGDLLRAK